MAPPLTVNRRPQIEIPVPAANSAATVSAAEAELQTPFDVPAFLRRPH